MNYNSLKRIINRMFGTFSIDSRGYSTSIEGAHISEHALETAKIIRGVERSPAIIIHGAMPRSGTVYTGELLRLHPELYAYPNDIWEVPFLELTGDLIDFQNHFFHAYRQNKSKIGNHDFLPLFGSSLISYLYSYVPTGRRMLLKIPDVQYLNFFNLVFPYENILLLLRDGRDAVSSTIRTWPENSFSNVCRLWDYSARMILNYKLECTGMANRCFTTKYEDVVRAPETFVKDICKCYGLNNEVYPYDKINEISIRGSSAIKSDGRVTWKAVEKPKNFSSVGRWQDWSVRQKKIFKKLAGQTLIDAGYSNNHDW